MFDTFLLDWFMRKLFKNDPKDLGPRKNAIRAFLIIGGFIAAMAAFLIWIAVE
jgi:hypothetical protein